VKRFLILTLLAACEQGINGAAGPPGDPGKDGSNGNDIILSERAKHGLDIAPVKLGLDGKTGAQIEAIGLGSYWVNAVIDCSGCHTGPKGYLAGGNKFPIDANGDFVISRNLTADPATGLKLTQPEFITAMHTGRDYHMDHNGGNGLLLVMPWGNLRWLHIEDLQAIYAYLGAIPAVANKVDADQKGPAEAATPIPLPNHYDRGAQTRAITPDFDAQKQALPDPDGVLRGIQVNPLYDPDNFYSMDAETQSLFGRGGYLVNAAVCSDCHTNPPYNVTPGPDFLKVDPSSFLKGGAVFVTPPGLEAMFGNQRSMSANLIGFDNGFFNEPGMTFSLFDNIITTGTHVDDSPARPLAWPMPYDHFRNMLTEDLVAVYTYMYTVANFESDNETDISNDKVTQPAAIWCDSTHACATGSTCNMDATFGNECVPDGCNSDADCGACQHCQPLDVIARGGHAVAGFNGMCIAPNPESGADQACVNQGIRAWPRKPGPGRPQASGLRPQEEKA
jgi:hypothetical protein